MAIRLTDADISRLLSERKPLPADFRRRISLKPKRGHREAQFDATGDEGSQFSVVLRQADANPLNFSVILGYRVSESNQVLRLRRYNGKHQHTNRIEGDVFYGFHVHKATERYQESGWREDAFAEETTRYSDLDGAVSCLLEDCGFEVQGGPEMPLFEGAP